MEPILFGQRLKNARDAMGLSREQMAERIGVKRATIEKWESGKVEPRANRLQTLASMLNVPLLWLLGGSQEVPDSIAPSREQILQKVISLKSKSRQLQAELEELSLMLQASE